MYYPQGSSPAKELWRQWPIHLLKDYGTGACGVSFVHVESETQSEATLVVNKMPVSLVEPEVLAIC
jgi:hypothetical protein